MKTNFKINLDTLGISAAALCLVHCMALPLLALLFPFFNLSLGSFLPNTAAWFEPIFIVLSITLAYISLRLTHKKLKNSKKPFYYFFFGVILFVLGFAFHHAYPLVSVVLHIAASLSMGTAHLLNRRMYKNCCTSRAAYPPTSGKYGHTKKQTAQSGCCR